MSYRCPQCKADTNLYEEVEVPGWRSVDARLQPTVGGSLHHEARWDEAIGMGEWGCVECSWSGAKHDLEEVGIDGEPLPAVHPNQTQIEVA